MATQLSPSPRKGAQPPNFWLMYVVAKGLNGSRCNLVRRQASIVPGDIVLDGDPGPPKMGHSAPAFRLMYVVGKRLVHGWIKMPLGTEVDHGPGHSVLDGAQLPVGKGHSTAAPLFSAHVCCGHS